MSKERIKSINKRMAWLSTELVHDNRYPGMVAKGFREELSKLIEELKELQDDISK